MLGWNKEGIHDEEAHKEVNTKQDLSIAETTKLSVTKESYQTSIDNLPVKEIPIPEALFAFSTKPIILFDAEPLSK